MMKWLIIIAIVISAYFLFFRKKNPEKEKFIDSIAEEIFKNYTENKEIARFTNPKTLGTVIVNHKSMRHILERHHPNYPPDYKHGKGSLFPERTTVQEINEGIETVLKTGERNKYREKQGRKHNVVYEGNTTVHNKRSLYRLVINQRFGRENVVTFFPVD